LSNLGDVEKMYVKMKAEQVMNIPVGNKKM
jgi:predicted regulator of Ras-like GTPase activity (Roadblock/LC7/MglB family)